MSNPKDPEYVNSGLRAAQIASELADGKRDYFAGLSGITMQKRTELEAELAHIKMRREELRAAHKESSANAKRNQLAILIEKLERIGLGYLVDESKVEAIESQP